MGSPSSWCSSQARKGSSARKAARATGSPASTPSALASRTARPSCSGGTSREVVRSSAARSSARAARTSASSSEAVSGNGARLVVISGALPEDDVSPPFLARLREVAAIVGATALLSQQGGLGGQAGAGQEVGQLVVGPARRRRHDGLPGGQQ